jgi:hypothetical protein
MSTNGLPVFAMEYITVFISIVYIIKNFSFLLYIRLIAAAALHLI